MVLLNRRGFSSFVACRSCGERVQCVNCASRSPVTGATAACCAITAAMRRRSRTVCPKCQSEHIYFMGAGSERVEEELHGEFPEARIARLDRDTVTGKRQFEDILQRFPRAAISTSWWARR